MDSCSVDDLLISQYFVPLTDHSDVDSITSNNVDYGNLYPVPRNPHPSIAYGCEKKCSKAKICKKPGKKRLEEDEQGIAMRLRSNSSKTKPESKESEKVGSEAPIVPNDCCHHNEPKGRRKYMISFGANSTGLNDDCIESEHSRCEAFWKFIDSQPDLLDMIKEGEFEHTSQPHLVVAPSKHPNSKPMCKEGEALRAKHQAIYSAVREMRNKRKKINNEIQRKSGQFSSVGKPIVLVKNALPIVNPPSYADSVNEDMEEMIREMKIFDKLSKNPVSMRPFSNLSINEEETKDGGSKSMDDQVIYVLNQAAKELHNLDK